MMLQSFGSDVTTAPNGKIALEIINENIQNMQSLVQTKTIDIIVIEINLPIMGGLEAIKFMKDSYKKYNLHCLIYGP